MKKFEEDQANKKWLDQSTMGCPSCHVKVEKSVGCNHVSVEFICDNQGAEDAVVDDMRTVWTTLLLPMWR